MVFKKSHFRFTKQERSGIFFLLLLIVLGQTFFWLYKYTSVSHENPLNLDDDLQAKIDTLKSQNQYKDSLKIFPFNPNYISDFKGYSLGLSIDEIDRLHDYRSNGLFVNSKEEFQEVTEVSDSLLYVISPYFKFPDWTRASRANSKKDISGIKTIDNLEAKNFKDLNRVTAQELKSINGIGDKLSERIIKFRDRLGGFLIDDQLNDVYGLKPEVVQRVFQKFKVLNAPEIKKVSLNTSTAKELAQLVYLQKKVAERIVEYRELNGEIYSFDELMQIDGFPTNRIDRIPLYLSLKK